MLRTHKVASLLGLATLAALGLAAALPAQAQTLLHRYSFNGDANDSVGGANGTLVGTPTFTTSSGDTSINLGVNTYVRLPNNINVGLTNSTIETFVTAFNYNNTPFQPIVQFAESGISGGPHFLIDAQRDTGNASTETGPGGEEQVDGSRTTDPTGTHQEAVTFSGFTPGGGTGTVTLYYDGAQIGQATGLSNDPDSLGVTPGEPTTLDTIGGPNFNFRSNFFQGSISEVRFYSGALSASQIAASFAAGPNAAPEPSPFAALGLGALGLAGLGLRARRRLPRSGA